MKHSLLIMISLVTGYFCNAQIVVDRTDFPHIGDLVVTAQDRVTTVSPGNAGPNQTWDFSNLVATNYDSALFIPVNQVPNWTLYPDANMGGQTLNPENGYAY